MARQFLHRNHIFLIHVPSWQSLCLAREQVPSQNSSYQGEAAQSKVRNYLGRYRGKLQQKGPRASGGTGAF